MFFCFNSLCTKNYELSIKKIKIHDKHEKLKHEKLKQIIIDLTASS